MTFLLPLLLLTAALPGEGDEAPIHVAVDGGVVPSAVGPKATEAVAKILAPELVSDGGTTLEGTPEPVVAPTTLSVYNVDLPAEAAITAGSFGLYLMVDLLVKPSLEGDTSCRHPLGNQCNPADLSSFDRYAVGKSSQAWTTFGDVALVTSILLPALYLGLESLTLPTKEPWGDWARDLLVVSEAIALTAGMDTVLKFAFRRPRPSRYLPVEQSAANFDAELSLPSGHVAMVTAATTALTTTIFFRHPESKVRYFALTAGILLSTMTAISRVESGWHFPTDVITGMVVGGFAGFMVPYLHRKSSKLRPSVAFNPATGTTMFAVSGPL